MRTTASLIVGLLVLTAGWGQMAGPGRGQTADEAKKIIDRSIQAHGGEDNLARLLLARTRAKGKLINYGGTGINIPFTADILVHLPGKSKLRLQIQLPGEKKVEIVEILNGRKAWRFDTTGMNMDLDGEELKAAQESAYADYVTSLVPLRRDKGFTLSVIDDAMVNGQPAVGVRVKCEGHKDIDMWFDKGNGLLVRTLRKTYDSGDMKEVTYDSILSDFRDVQGLKTPFRANSSKDGKPSIEMEVIEMQFLDKIDPKEFHRTL